MALRGKMKPRARKLEGMDDAQLAGLMQHHDPEIAARAQRVYDLHKADAEYKRVSRGYR